MYLKTIHNVAGAMVLGLTAAGSVTGGFFVTLAAVLLCKR